MNTESPIDHHARLIAEKDAEIAGLRAVCNSIRAEFERSPLGNGEGESLSVTARELVEYVDSLEEMVSTNAIREIQYIRTIAERDETIAELRDAMEWAQRQFAGMSDGLDMQGRTTLEIRQIEDAKTGARSLATTLGRRAESEAAGGGEQCSRARIGPAATALAEPELQRHGPRVFGSMPGIVVAEHEDQVRDESKPPPGWCCRPGFGIVREGMVVDTPAEAWNIYDAEHGYAPPNMITRLAAQRAVACERIRVEHEIADWLDGRATHRERHECRDAEMMVEERTLRAMAHNIRESVYTRSESAGGGGLVAQARRASGGCMAEASSGDTMIDPDFYCIKCGTTEPDSELINGSDLCFNCSPDDEPHGPVERVVVATGHDVTLSMQREINELRAAMQAAAAEIETMVDGDPIEAAGNAQRMLLDALGRPESVYVPATNGMRNAPACPKCGTANYTIRKRCRHCGEYLVTHPDPETDAEVRWDAEEGRRSEAAGGGEQVVLPARADTGAHVVEPQESEEAAARRLAGLLTAPAEPGYCAGCDVLAHRCHKHGVSSPGVVVDAERRGDMQSAPAEPEPTRGFGSMPGIVVAEHEDPVRDESKPPRSAHEAYRPGAPWQVVLGALRECAARWEPAICLLGNVHAEDIVLACDAALGGERACDTLRWLRDYVRIEAPERQGPEYHEALRRIDELLATSLTRKDYSVMPTLDDLLAQSMMFTAVDSNKGALFEVEGEPPPEEMREARIRHSCSEVHVAVARNRAALRVALEQVLSKLQLMYRALPRYPTLGSMGGGSSRETELQERWERDVGAWGHVFLQLQDAVEIGLRTAEQALLADGEREPEIEGCT